MNGITTFIEVILNQELGEPFRRDAMKADCLYLEVAQGGMPLLIVFGESESDMQVQYPVI